MLDMFTQQSQDVTNHSLIVWNKLYVANLTAIIHMLCYRLAQILHICLQNILRHSNHQHLQELLDECFPRVVMVKIIENNKQI